MSQCFHKTYRYLAYANSLYSFLTADAETTKEIIEASKDEDEQAEEAMQEMRQEQLQKRGPKQGPALG